MAEGLAPGDPRRAGPYELLGRLGGGGMGQVFLGRSPGGRPVAVKVIRPELLVGQTDFRARFAREVAAARRVNALFTAPVVDADPDAPMPWLVTAYVPGPSLDDAVSDHGPLGLDVLRALAAALAEGLAAIHAAGLVHRDLKPSNVLLAADGPRIIDFGISRVAEASGLTGTGMIVGSPAFMSPEQVSAHDAGAPSDVFSLGSVLTFAATGHGPFRGPTVPSLLYQVASTEPDLGGVPAELLPLIAHCLAKDPLARPAPAQIIAEVGHTGVLEDWLPGPIARTLHRYAPPAVPAPPHPLTDPTRPVPPAPPTVSPARPYPGPVPPQPYLRPVPPRPYPRQVVRPIPVPAPARTGPFAALPAEYRFGWMAVPVALLVAVAAFVMPLETATVAFWGFAVVVVASRVAAAIWWVRARGARGLAGRAVTVVLRDLLGAAGLILLAIVTLIVEVDVLLPAIGPGNPQDYRQALSATAPADPFSSLAQAWFFLHVFLVLPALALALVVLARVSGNLRRPLLLPRAARLLNRQTRPVRVAVAGALVALAVVLAVVNGGLSPSRAPSGAICTLAPQTCAAAAQVRRAVG